MKKSVWLPLGGAILAISGFGSFVAQPREEERGIDPKSKRAVFVARGEVIAVQKDMGQLRLSAFEGSKLAGRDAVELRRHFLETERTLILRDVNGREIGTFEATRVDVDQGTKPKDVRGIMLYGYFRLSESARPRVAVGFRAGLYEEVPDYLPPVRYAPEPRRPLMEIRHGVDQKMMVYVPDDYVVMGQGSDPALDNYNPHFIERDATVTPRLKAFYMDKYEVTNKEYFLFCAKTGHPVPPSWLATGGTYLAGMDDHPVTVASYRDAEAYATWTGKRLPSEQEWEMAARGGISTVVDATGERSIFRAPPSYPYGNVFDERLCNTLESGAGSTISVYDTKDISPYGLHGMCGNAREWTADWYAPYRDHRFRKGAPGGRFFKVIRGGSYHQDRRSARSDARDYGGMPTLQDDRSAGFRLVISAE